MSKTLNKIHNIARSMIGLDPVYSFSPLHMTNGHISIINISGILGKRISADEKDDGKIDVDDITDALKVAATADTEVVILWINSPGGTSTGIDELGQHIKNLTLIKPVLTFTDTICASAAMWLASCTNGIYLTPTAEVGSIGVYAKVVDMSENLALQGVNVQVFSAGDQKTMGQAERPLTEEECKLIQSDIDAQWLKFKTLVTDNRGEVKEENMQGQLFTGESAVAVNLADKVVLDFPTLLSEITTQITI